MSILEPKRLLDSDERSPLTSALQKARADLGHERELARVRGKLVLGAASTLSMTGAAMSTGTGTAAAKAVKAWWLAGVLFVGAAVFVAVPSHAPRSASPRIDPHAVSARKVTASTTAPAIDATPVLDHAAAAPAPTVAREQAESVPVKPRAQARKLTPPAVSTAKPAVALHATEEIALLQRAQKVVDTRPSEALAILGEHARAYPSGVFVQERESLAIDALRKLGRAEAAQKRARSFIARYPSSPHARRFSSWLDPNAAIDDEPITKPGRSTY